MGPKKGQKWPFWGVQKGGTCYPPEIAKNSVFFVFFSVFHVHAKMDVFDHKVECVLHKIRVLRTMMKL